MSKRPNKDEQEEAKAEENQKEAGQGEAEDDEEFVKFIESVEAARIESSRFFFCQIPNNLLFIYFFSQTKFSSVADRWSKADAIVNDLKVVEEERNEEKGFY